MSQAFSTPAIVLKRKNIGEADRLITLFTRNLGKLVVRAKGVRLSKSKRAAHVELFNTVNAQIIEGKSIPTLAQTELLLDRSFLKQNEKRLRIAFYLVEVTERLIAERQQNTEVFDLLDRALSSVGHRAWDKEDNLVEEYEKRILRLLGFGVPADGKPKDYIEGLIDHELVSRKILCDNTTSR